MVSEGAGLVQICGGIMNSSGDIVASQKNITVFYTSFPGTALGNLLCKEFDA